MGLVVFVNSGGFPYTKSALTEKLRLLGKAISEGGSEVTFINRFSNNSLKNISGKSEGLNFIFLQKRSSNFLIDFINSIKNEVFFLRNMRKNILTKKFLILSYMPFYLFLYYIFIAKIYKFEVVINIMEWHVSFKHKTILKRINSYLFDNYSFFFCKKVLTITHEIKEKISEKHDKEIIVIPPLIDKNDFIDLNCMDFGRQYLLYCGGIGYIDSINFVIELYSKLKDDYNLMLILNGNLTEIESLIKSIYEKFDKNKVIIKYNLDRRELYKYYASAKFLIMPFRNNDQDYYRFPQKIAEYLVSGSKVLTNNIGNLNRGLNNENSLIAKNLSVSAYLEAMQSDKIISKKERIEQARKLFYYKNHINKLKKFFYAKK